MFPLLFLLLLLARKYKVHVSAFSYHDLCQLTEPRRYCNRALPQNQRTSGVTLDGLLALLSTHSPTIVLLENVPVWKCASSPNYGPLMNKLEALGYKAEARKVVSLQFGVCQRRKREYVIGYKIVRCKPRQYTEDALKRCLDLALSFRTSMHDSNGSTVKFDGVPVSERLLKPNDKYLQDEFARRREQRIRADASAEKKDAVVWREANRSTLERMGVSVSECALPKEEQGDLCYDLLTPRQKLALGYTYLTNDKFANSEINHFYFNRGNFVSRGERMISALVLGSCKWLRKERRLLTGYEAFSIQGVPTEVSDYGLRCGYTVFNFMELAGKSFQAEMIGAFFIAALVEYPFEGEEEDRKLSEVSTTVLSVPGMSFSILCASVPLYFRNGLCSDHVISCNVLPIVNA